MNSDEENDNIVSGDDSDSSVEMDSPGNKSADSESNSESDDSDDDPYDDPDDDSDYKLLVDKRELAVYKSGIFDILLKNQFSSLGISVVLQQMTTADFAITYKDNILILIERKTWKDLSATFTDKKRKFNYNKLIDEKKKSPTCIMIAYLIEGNFKTNRNSKIQRTPLSRLLCHLDHLMLEHNIHILRSKDKEDTAFRILELMKNILTMHKDNNPIMHIDESEGCPKNITGGALKALTARKDVTDDTVKAQMWSSVKGVSLTLASIFIENNFTLTGMLTGEYKPKQIGAIRYPSGRIIGEKHSKKLIDKYKSLLVNTDPDELLKGGANLLSSIPRISKNMASKILEHIPLVELITLKTSDASKIADIKMGKRRVGKVAAANIIKFLK